MGASGDQERGWRQMWMLHLPLFAAYLSLAILQYFRLGARALPHDEFFWHQLVLSKTLVEVIALHLLGMLAWHRHVWLARWRAFWDEPGTPVHLALLRVICVGYILVDQIFNVPREWQPLTALPASARQPLPLIGWMVEAMPITEGLYHAANVACIVFAVLAFVGLFTRPALLAMIPLVFYIYGVPQFYGKLSHYQFLFWITVILFFSPCDATWSVDALWARLRGRRRDLRPSRAYGQALRWLMLSLAIVYGFSGVRKLWESGLFWALSDNPVNLLRTEWLEHFGEVPALRVDRHPVLCSMGAMGVILFELSYPFLILGRRSRVVAAVGAVAFHSLNGLLLKIDFQYLKSAHWPYLDWGAIARRWRKAGVGRRWLAAGAVYGLTVMLTGVLFLLLPFLLVALVDVLWHMRGRVRRGRWLLRLARRVPDPPRLRWEGRRWATFGAVVCGGMVAANGLFAMLGIHTWPISAYPAYSFVRGPVVEYGWFLPQTADHRPLDIDTEARRQGLRKENVLPMAERIVVAWRYDRAMLGHEVLACWQRWQTELPALKAATTATVVVLAYPIDPDRYDEPPAQTTLGRLELSHGEWTFVPDSLSPPVPRP